MVITAAYAGQRLTVSLKPTALSLMFGTTDVLTYDRGGRLWLALLGGRAFRRGLNGRVIEKWTADGITQRRHVAPDAGAALLDRCAARSTALRADAAAGRVAWDMPPPSELTTALERAAGFDAASAAADAARFGQVYDPVGILPPDQYVAVVLQATTGCSFNSCTFCDFYKGRRFRVKNPAPFRAHAQAVKAFLGDSLSLRRTIFFGEANATAAPTERLLELMQIAREEFGPRPIHAFQDGFSGQRKSIAEYQALAAYGLQRVSIGLESGHDPLLEFVRKPSTSEEVAAAVATLKNAGVAVSLIVLVGLGGDRYAERHVADSVALLNSLPLGAGDLVYLSDLQPQPGTAYPAQAQAAGIRALDSTELQAQRRAIQSGLQFASSGPRVAPYNIQEFVY